MKINLSLNIKNKQMFDLLNTWFDEYLENKMTPIEMKFSNKLNLGNGSTNYDIHTSQIIIGIDPIIKSFYTKNWPIKDSDFVTIGITLFHELAHFDHKISKDTQKEILISDISTYHNKKYYEENWYKPPHEIDAEYTGVISMRSRLKEMHADVADFLILDHLTFRANETKYMINEPKNGFRSINQIEIRFENAYEQSLTKQRTLPPGFLRYDDEISKLLTTEDGVLRIEYEPFFRQLATATTGQELDLKMASLVSYIHPELQKLYSQLNFAELNPKFIFGIPMPETTSEIKTRLNVKAEANTVSKSIRYISNIERRPIYMDVKSKRKELLHMDDRTLVDRILAFPDRERLNRDDEGKRRKYPSAEMAVRARRSMEKDPDYKISDKQRFAMADSFAQYSTNTLKVAGITFAKADPNNLAKKEVSKEGVKTVYDMTFRLEPEPENEHDKNAVAVYVANATLTGREKIGYVPGTYVAEHPIVHPMEVKGTLTDHSNGHFKTISYTMDMDTEAIDKEASANRNPDLYTYRMPFILNGEPNANTADYLNTQYWTSDNDQHNGWTERLNNELEYWGVNGRAENVYFEFPGGRAGNIIVESQSRLNAEAIQICGSYFRYSLESGVSSNLKRDGYVKVPVNVSAINTREKTYFSLQAEPNSEQNINDFSKAVRSIAVEDDGWSI